MLSSFCDFWKATAVSPSLTRENERVEDWKCSKVAKKGTYGKKEREKIQMNGSRSSNKKHQGANVLNGFGGRLVNEVSKSPQVDWCWRTFAFFCTRLLALLLFSFNVVVRFRIDALHCAIACKPQKFDWTIRKITTFLQISFYSASWEFSKGQKNIHWWSGVSPRWMCPMLFYFFFKQFKLATILSRPFGRWFFNHIHLNQLPGC